MEFTVENIIYSIIQSCRVFQSFQKKRKFVYSDGKGFTSFKCDQCNYTNISESDLGQHKKMRQIIYQDDGKITQMKNHRRK